MRPSTPTTHPSISVLIMSEDEIFGGRNRGPREMGPSDFISGIGVALLPSAYSDNIANRSIALISYSQNHF